MKLVAEYLENTNQLLIRLLSDPAIPSDIVQLGIYKVDGTPQIPGIIDVDIISDDIKSGEAHVLLTGYWPLPEYVIITLPDLSEQKIPVVKVMQHTSNWEPSLKEQPIEAITPIPTEDRRPGESANPYVPEATLPAEYPSVWLEVSFERTDPVRLGSDMTSDPIVYAGGGKDRGLSSDQRQLATDAVPWLSYAPLRLEGQFTNSLFNSNFSLSPSWPTPYFDPVPDGWSVVLADPTNLIRLQTTPPDSVLPAFTLRFSPRPDSNVALPAVTILSPAVTNVGETFEAIIAPALGNLTGSVQLKTQDDALASPVYNLIPGQSVIASLAIGTHVGRIKIVWNPAKSEQQIIQIVAPCSSVYTGGHTYIPTTETSYADIVTLDNIDYIKPWYFNKGSIRIDATGDVPSQPFSWKLMVGSQILFRLDSGILTSDFMTSPSVTISSYLTSVLSYKLIWTSPTVFKLSDLTGSTVVSIPFSLDISSLSGSSASMSLEIMGYKAGEGSAIAKRWEYRPSV